MTDPEGNGVVLDVLPDESSQDVEDGKHEPNQGGETDEICTGN
jgi:hypothetical protein